VGWRWLDGWEGALEIGTVCGAWEELLLPLIGASAGGWAALPSNCPSKKPLPVCTAANTFLYFNHISGLTSKHGAGPPLLATRSAALLLLPLAPRAASALRPPSCATASATRQCTP
jgi:hypothetical protein